MDNLEASCPRLQTAIAQMRAAMDRQHKATTDLEHRRIQQEQNAVWGSASQAYALELLPQVLDGEWIVSDGSDYELVTGWSRPLFDHHVCFRRKGMKGPNRWEICAIIAHPYGPLERDADGQAAELHTKGISVWVREDLSAWFPGWTRLVIAAKGLDPDRAASFGFGVLGDRTQWGRTISNQEDT